MTHMDETLVIVRGAGDIATGTIVHLARCGRRVLALESQRPTAIRRTVALSDAVYHDTARVEEITARRVADEAQMHMCWDAGEIPVAVDPQGQWIERLKPGVVIDAILAKRNLGTNRTMAPVTVALGPGFCAGRDVDAVIETMRGHTLGRVIRSGEPIPNTNIPGLIGGFTGERVLRAPDDGIFHQLADIGARVQAGDVVGEVNGKPMACTIAGVIRGMLADGTPVYKGMKSGDVDPRGELSYCYTASDKAIAIGGGVLQAILEYTGVLSNVTGQNAWEV